MPTAQFEGPLSTHSRRSLPSVAMPAHALKKPCQRELGVAQSGGRSMTLGNDHLKHGAGAAVIAPVAGLGGSWHGANGGDRRSALVPLAQPRAVEGPYRVEPRLAVRRLRDLRPVPDCRFRHEAAA